MAVGDTDLAKSSTLNTDNVNIVGDSSSAHPAKPVQGMTDDQYPHGLNWYSAQGRLLSLFSDCIGPGEHSTHSC
jgi:hypothetical protein